jgi:putative membrane protein
MRRVFMSFALALIGLFAAIGCSVAQTPAPSTAPTQTAPVTTSAQPTRQLSAIDQQFMLEAAQAGNGNIMISQLALQQGNSDAVRQFAQAEIDEQNLVKQELTRIAPTVGVTLPTEPAPKYQAAMAQLSQLSGEQFDAAFLNEGGINAHLENAALFQREAAFGQNPDLVALADRGLPIINQHFTTASGLTNYQFAQVPQRFSRTNSAGAIVPQPGTPSVQ